MGRISFILIARLFEALFRLVYVIFILLKWLIIPPVILFDLLVLFPIGRFIVKVNRTPAFREINMDDLPDAVWMHMEEVRRRFARQGFISGKCLFSDNAVPDINNYTLTMVNHDQGMGVGVIYLKPQKAKDDIFDKTACEFSCLLNARYVDMSNTEMIEGFLPMPERDRLMLREYDDDGLYRIYRKFIEVNDCRLDENILKELQHNPRLIINDEMKAMFTSYLQRGLIYASGSSEYYRLTWKGAWQSTLQTLWPMSTWYNNRMRRYALDFLNRHGVDAEQVAWGTDEADGEAIISIAEPIQSIGQVLELSRRMAADRIMKAQPVSIAISLVSDDGPPRWSTIDVHYEEGEDYPQRKSIWRSTITVNISNDEMEAMLMDDEEYMFSYEQAKDNDIQLREPLPTRMDVVVDPVTALQVMMSALDKNNDDDDYIDGVELKMHDKQLSWCGVHYAEETMLELFVDAVNGQFIAKNEKDYA